VSPLVSMESFSHRQPMQRSHVRPVGQGVVGCLGGLHGALTVDGDDRVQACARSLDAGEVQLEQLSAAQLPPLERCNELWPASTRVRRPHAPPQQLPVRRSSSRSPGAASKPRGASPSLRDRWPGARPRWVPSAAACSRSRCPGAGTPRRAEFSAALSRWRSPMTTRSRKSHLAGLPARRERAAARAPAQVTPQPFGPRRPPTGPARSHPTRGCSRRRFARCRNGPARPARPARRQ
jgi:hypothetical protein